MILRLRVIILLALIMISAVSADQLGGLFFGADYIPDPQFKYTRVGSYELRSSGLTFGFYLPVNVPVLDCHYRMKASVHNIEKRSWDYGMAFGYPEQMLYDHHASVLNEVLLGKEFRFLSDYGFLPQAGVGVLIESLYDTDGTNVGAGVNHCVFTDLSLTLRKHLPLFGVALGINFQYGVRSSWEGYTSSDRLGMSLGVFR